MSSCQIIACVIYFLLFLVVGAFFVFTYRTHRERIYINYFVFMTLVFGCLGFGYFFWGLIGIIYGAGIAILCGLPLESYLILKRAKEVVTILHEGDPESFLLEIEKDIKRSAVKSRRDYLNINKSAGLYYLGRWQEALGILDAISITKLPKITKLLYVNNKLANLTGIADVSAAQKLLDENKELLNIKILDRLLFYSLKSNQAKLEFLKGDLVKSRVWLEECLQAGLAKTAQSVLYYYLGLIDQKEGKDQSARQHFQKSFDSAPKTFFGKKAKEQIV